MRFAFSPTEERTSGLVTELELPLNRYLSAAMRQGFNDSLFGVAMRFSENNIHDEGPMLSPEEANKVYGLPTLKFDRPVREGIARLKHDRKRAELDRQFYLESASTFSGRWWAGLGTQMVSSMLNPVDIALAFTPIVGSARMAESASLLGRASWRSALARGLITEESLKQLGVPRVAGPLIEGIAGQTIAEVPLAVSNYYDQANYTATDMVVNILGSGLIAGGIHFGITGASKLFKKLRPETKEAMLKQAHEQFLSGEPIRIDEYVNIDENIIREKVVAQETRIVEDAKKSANVEDARATVERILKGDEQVTAAAFRDPETGRVYTGAAHYLIELPLNKSDNELEPGFITNKGTFITRDEATRFVPPEHRERAKADNAADSVYFDFFERERYQQAFESELRSGGVNEPEIKQRSEDEMRRYDAQKREEWFQQPHIREMVDSVHQKNIQKVIEDAKKKFDPQKAFSEEARAEIARQIEAGKIVPDAVIQKYGLDPRDYQKLNSVLDEQINQVKQELESSDLTPQERAELEAATKSQSQFTSEKAGDKVAEMKSPDPEWQVVVQPAQKLQGKPKNEVVIEQGLWRSEEDGRGQWGRSGKIKVALVNGKPQWLQYSAPWKDWEGKPRPESWEPVPREHAIKLVGDDLTLKKLREIHPSPEASSFSISTALKQRWDPGEYGLSTVDDINAFREQLRQSGLFDEGESPDSSRLLGSDDQTWNIHNPSEMGPTYFASKFGNEVFFFKEEPSAKGIGEGQLIEITGEEFDKVFREHRIFYEDTFKRIEDALDFGHDLEDFLGSPDDARMYDRARQDAIKIIEDTEKAIQSASEPDVEIPGYIQIDDVSGGVNHWSKSPEKLKAEGYDIPDLSGLPQGKYTMREAMEKLGKTEEVSMKDVANKAKNCIKGGTDAT